jgi:hypothetical protein
MKNESIWWYHAFGNCLSPYKAFLSLHTSYYSPLHEPLMLIHVDVHLQHFIQKYCLYVHLVDLPIFGSSCCENTSNNDELGHGGKGLVEIHSNNFKIFICY